MKQKIENVIALYKALDEAWTDALKVFGGSPETPLYEASWRVFDALVEEIDGEEEGWLWWFIFENACGEGDGLAGYDDNLAPVKSVDGLIKLMEEGNKRTWAKLNTKWVGR